MLDVGLSPTYTGCPATDHIAELARRALERAAVGEFAVRHVLAPAWTSDWITPEGRRKLDEYGIVPPAPAAVVVLARLARSGCPSLVRGAARREPKQSASSARRPARRCTAAATVWSRSSASSASDGNRVLHFPPARSDRRRPYRRGCGLREARRPGGAARSLPARRRSVRDAAPRDRRPRGAAHLFHRDAAGRGGTAHRGARANRRAHVARARHATLARRAARGGHAHGAIPYRRRCVARPYLRCLRRGQRHHAGVVARPRISWRASPRAASP